MKDFNKLRLKHHGDKEKLWEILQEECRFKTAKKLPETLKNPDFVFPSLAVAEMATSDAVADVHVSMITEGESVLDMTCGLGIDAFHLARKASTVTTVEIDHESFEAALHNSATAANGNVTVVEADSIKWLEKNNKKFDVIFIDPARRDSVGRHFALKDCQPDVTAALPLLLSRCKRLIIKCSPMLSIDAAAKELGVDCDVTIIGTAKECKEVVFILPGSLSESDEPEQNGNKTNTHTRTIKSVTIGHPDFEYTSAADREAELEFANPQPGGYLYEPYPSVMKGGGYRALAQRFGIGKPHPNTHLYYSPTVIENFPGERFRIADIIPSSKQAYRDFAKQYPKINVATRNFPLSAPELVKKLRVKEGGENMVFGTTVTNGDKVLVVTDMGV